MEQQEIFEKVAEVFKDVFNDDTPLTMHTSRDDVKAWDSMGQMSFVSKLEDVFSVKFKMKDLVSFRSIDKIVEAIEKLVK